MAIENIKGTLSRDLQHDVFSPSAAKSHRYLNILIDITEIYTVLLHILGISTATLLLFPLTFFYKVDLVCGPRFFLGSKARCY